MSQAGSFGGGNSPPGSDVSLSPFIVGPTKADYSTIQAGINAATAAGASATNPVNVYIKPQNGGYAENLTITDGVNLIAFDPINPALTTVKNSVKLTEGITLPAGTSSNKFVNLEFTGTGGATAAFITGGTNTIDLEGCCVNGGQLFDIVAATTLTASFNNSQCATGVVLFQAATFLGNLTWNINNSVIDANTANYSANTATITTNNSYFDTSVTVSGTGVLSYTSQGQLGTGPSFNTSASSGNVTLLMSSGIAPANLNLNGAATNSITIGGASINSSTKKELITYANRTVNASTTLLFSDTVMFVNSASGTYTMTMPLANLLTSGRSFRIVDSGGNASVNNITIAGNGLNINGAASFIMNTNYQSVELSYDGTQFLIV